MRKFAIYCCNGITDVVYYSQGMAYNIPIIHLNTRDITLSTIYFEKNKKDDLGVSGKGLVRDVLSAVGGMPSSLPYVLGNILNGAKKLLLKFSKHLMTIQDELFI